MCAEALAPGADLLLDSRMVTCTLPSLQPFRSCCTATPSQPRLLPSPASPYSQVPVLTVTNAHATLSHVHSPQNPSGGKLLCSFDKEANRGSEGLFAQEHTAEERYSQDWTRRL